MTRTSRKAIQAIQQSIDHDEIVTLAWTAELEHSLRQACEAYEQATPGDLEFWGVYQDSQGDSDPVDWRVHLRKQMEAK